MKLSEKFIDYGQCRVCRRMVGYKDHRETCPVPEVRQLEAENEQLRELEESLYNAWPIINGVLVVPPDGVLETPDVAGRILDIIFEALGGE